MRCSECGSQLRWTDGPITEKVRGVSVTVDGIGHYACEKCGNTVMDIRSAEFLAKRQAQEVAKEKGLLSPEEIKGIRKSLGLKQHDFETLIGVSSPTASRWETGAMLPSKTTDTLIRVLAEFPEVVEFLSSRSLDATFAVDATARVGCPSAQRPQ
jgi:putative zinc finger/helix-turn-helix YgiT family protein